MRRACNSPRATRAQDPRVADFRNLLFSSESQCTSHRNVCSHLGVYVLAARLRGAGLFLHGRRVGRLLLRQGLRLVRRCRCGGGLGLLARPVLRGAAFLKRRSKGSPCCEQPGALTTQGRTRTHLPRGSGGRPNSSPPSKLSLGLGLTGLRSEVGGGGSARRGWECRPQALQRRGPAAPLTARNGASARLARSHSLMLASRCPTTQAS